jgi:hypothetical protein
MDQVSDFLDGSPTKEEALRLNEWIKSDPRNVRRFVREAIIHSHLHDLLKGEASIRQQTDERTAMISCESMVLPAVTAEPEPEEIVVLPPTPITLPQAPPPGIFRRPWFWAASIMMPLLAGFVVYRLVAQPQSFATVGSGVDAQWGGATVQLQAGQRLPGTPLVLQSGVAEIKFDTGVTMIVEAPARFQVRAANSVDLTSGQISAKVPEGAHGFAVQTTTTRIVDLGTEFGVVISADGSDEIDVFKGNVRAAPQAAGTVAPLLLSEGQAAISTGHDIKLDPAGAQPQAFVRSLILPDSIDVVDLICGGDGSTHLRSGAIDQRTGESGLLISKSGPTVVPSDYHNVPRLQVVDGCFIPNGTDIVDSARHTFDFGATNARTLYKILAGGTIPWPRSDEPFSAVLGGVDYSQPSHGLILLHPNVGITFDLAAIRRIHPGVKLADFQAVVGNTCPGASRSAKAHVFVLVDGVSRSDLPALSQSDGAVNLRVSLAEADRFLTIAIADNRTTVARNWIILGDPRLE